MKNFQKNILTTLAASSVLLGSQAVTAGQDMNKHEDKAAHSGKTDNALMENTKEAWQETKAGAKELSRESKLMFQEGIIAGRLESAIILNEHLNPFDIDIDVHHNTVTLSGEVESTVDRDLAENIAKGIKGVEEVNNNIVTVLKPAQRDYDETRNDYVKGDGDREFTQFMNDVSTTASIKTELLANEHVEGLDIDVDTYKDTVTLSGEVASSKAKSLAEAIAEKRDNVEKVINNIEVNS